MGIVVHDENFWYVSIDTDQWIENRLGEALEYKCSGDWAAEQYDSIVEFLNAKTGLEFEFKDSGNTYNHENHFSSTMQFHFFVPVGSTDWLYDKNLYVAIEQHRGGDVRGNYGAVELYKVWDGSYFYDWTLNWVVWFANGDEVPQSEQGQYDAGWSSNSSHHLDSHMRKTPVWSERYQCFVGWHKPTGRAVKITPVFHEV